MLQMNGTGGLCMTCNNQPVCYYHARRGPAIYCETFDNYVPSRTSAIGERSPGAPAASMAPRTEDIDDHAYKGLCLNCEHRTTCGDRRTSAGVWHCESYA